jgi:hypothetical protein
MRIFGRDLSEYVAFSKWFIPGSFHLSHLRKARVLKHEATDQLRGVSRAGVFKQDSDV